MKPLSDIDYEKALSELIDYACEDWLDVGIVASAMRECFDHMPSYQEVRPLAIRAVRDLINAGAVAGDIIAEGDKPWRFEPWKVTPHEAIDRITAGLRQRDSYIDDPGELGWLLFPG